MVYPMSGGMSASPDDPLHLPVSRRPPELGGVGKDPVFFIEEGALGEALRFRPDPKNPRGHGFVEPALPMTVERYQQALCDTGARWSRLS